MPNYFESMTAYYHTDDPFNLMLQIYYGYSEEEMITELLKFIRSSKYVDEALITNKGIRELNLKTLDNIGIELIFGEEV